MGAGHQDTGSQAASASAFTAASMASRSSQRNSSRQRAHRKHRNTTTATLTNVRQGSTAHVLPGPLTASSSDEIDRLIESEGDEGVDMIKVFERQDVFHLIHEIRCDLRITIDTHLSWDELTSVDFNFTIVRPLAIKYSGFRSIAILYCLLLNRIYFQREAHRDLAFQNVNTTRAALCELLSIKLLRTFSNDGLELVTALSASFHPLSGATGDELAELAASSSAISLGVIRDEGLPAEQFSSTLELAILSKAKKLISSPLCQRCIDGIWHGKVVLSPVQASHAIVNDSYKRRPLSIYDPHMAPLLNHLRLRVPSIRNRLEFFNFLVILFLYVLALAQKGAPTWTLPETFFAVWLLGMAVDELAQLQERGIAQYLTSFYNMLDFFFCAISFCWLGLRISALRHDLTARSDLSFDCLALGAVLLCPRVASSLVQDNVVMLSLKAMISDFAFFTVLAAICFSGFSVAFFTLATDPRWTFKEVLWLMLKVWFGSSYLGFDEAKSFTLEFGPPLMILYTILSNTLLLTVLISLLSNTFQIVAMNASEEAMYQFACKTMAGITTDAIFSYQPPLNLLAVIIVMPLSYVLTPRWLHKVNVFMIRLTSFPVLLLIRFLELNSFAQGISLSAEKGKGLLSWMPIVNSSLDGWGGNGGLDVIEAAFDYRPPSSSGSSAASSLCSSDHESGGESDVDDSDDSKRGRAREAARRAVEGSWEEQAAERFEQAVSDHKHSSFAAAKAKEGQEHVGQDAGKSAAADGRAPAAAPAALEAEGQLADQAGKPTGAETPGQRIADHPSAASHAQDPKRDRSASKGREGAHDGNGRAVASPHRSQRTKTCHRPRKGYEARGLGSLSSPLAKLYGRFNQQPSSLSQQTTPVKDYSKAGRRKSKEEAVFQDDDADAGDQGGASRSMSPVGRDSVSETRHLMEKLREMEVRNKRIEDLLLRMIEEREAAK